MARNSYQILGQDLSFDNSSRFVVCWTPGGEEVGGTSQAIRIAKYYGIPIFNLFGHKDHSGFVKFMKSHGLSG